MPIWTYVAGDMIIDFYRSHILKMTPIKIDNDSFIIKNTRVIIYNKRVIIENERLILYNRRVIISDESRIRQVSTNHPS